MSIHTPVVNKHHGVSSNAVYIGRGSSWGNPYPITKSFNRFKAIEAYEEYLLGNKELLEDLKNIYGKTLLCFCAPAPCHGDILAYYADYLHETDKLPDSRGITILYPKGDPDKPKKTLFNI